MSKLPRNQLGSIYPNFGSLVIRKSHCNYTRDPLLKILDKILHKGCAFLDELKIQGTEHDVVISTKHYHFIQFNFIIIPLNST